MRSVKDARLSLPLTEVMKIARLTSSLSSFSPNFPNCSSPRESASVYVAYPRSHFSVSQPEATSLSSAEPRVM